MVTETNGRIDGLHDANPSSAGSGRRPSTGSGQRPSTGSGQRPAHTFDVHVHDRGELTETCRRVMAARGLTPASPRAAMERAVREALAGLHVTATTALVDDLVVALSGWGPLHGLFDDPACEEIWWNDPSRIFVARAGVTELSPVALTETEARALVMRAVTASGRRLDTAHPFVDVPLPEGARLHVAVPPITAGHWAVNIRRQVLRPTTLADLTHLGMLTLPAQQYVAEALRQGANVLVSGGTHTGKTTVLNALLGSAASHRVISCEEVRELSLPHADWVPLQTRDAGLEGTGAVSLRDLVRESLRMRPSRLVVGEVRGAEALDLLLAMNCGVPAAATIHANSAEDAVDKLVGLPMLAGPNISEEFLHRTVGSCLDLVIHLGRADGGTRVVEQICSVTPGNGRPLVGRLFHRVAGQLVRGGAELATSGASAPW